MASRLLTIGLIRAGPITTAGPEEAIIATFVSSVEAIPQMNTQGVVSTIKMARHRKAFELAQKPVRAILFASGLGHFNMSVNGQPASDHRCIIFVHGPEEAIIATFVSSVEAIPQMNTQGVVSTGYLVRVGTRSLQYVGQWPAGF
jgi:hypothetical protein